MYYTYIIQSDKDSSYYVGYTSNLEKRLKFHNEGFSEYTRRKLPWKLAYFEEFDTKIEALRREKFLKKQRNRSFYKKLIENFKGAVVQFG